MITEKWLNLNITANSEDQIHNIVDKLDTLRVYAKSAQDGIYCVKYNNVFYICGISYNRLVFVLLYKQNTLSNDLDFSNLKYVDYVTIMHRLYTRLQNSVKSDNELYETLTSCFYKILDPVDLSTLASLCPESTAVNYNLKTDEQKAIYLLKTNKVTLEQLIQMFGGLI